MIIYPITYPTLTLLHILQYNWVKDSLGPELADCVVKAEEVGEPGLAGQDPTLHLLVTRYLGVGEYYQGGEQGKIPWKVPEQLQKDPFLFFSSELQNKDLLPLF